MPLSVYQKQGRDHHGNLPGGMTNMTMQGHVQGDTLEDIEAKRYQAHMQAMDHATFPRQLDLNGVTIPLYKFAELDSLGRETLKKRCLDMRDMIEATGSRFFEHRASSGVELSNRGCRWVKVCCHTCLSYSSRP